jgi:hypothetical protein
MDRRTINIAKAQIGFIEAIVKPSFESIAKVLPRIEKSYLRNCLDNKKQWEALVEEYEK